MQVDASGTQATVTGAIRQAARMTGTSFQYLLATAQIESNFNPSANVATSSARGLFQFIDQTWLATLKQHGTALGYGPYADSIVRLPSGRYGVTDPAMVRPIMNLRGDPTANAMMAGAFTRTNAATLSERLGRQPTEGELYIAHFLGPNGAARLIGTAEQRPGVAAAQVFPNAARANHNIFFDRQGNARSIGAVYRNLVGRYDVARTAPSQRAATKFAHLDAASAATSVIPPEIAQPTGPAHVLAQLTPQASAGPPARRDATAEPQARSLFTTAARREPVAPWLMALWSTPRQAHEPQQVSSNPARSSSGMSESRQAVAPASLGLFQDQAPDVGALFRGRG